MVRRSSGDDPDEVNTFHKQSITSKAYYNTILPNSQRRPYLILFYSDWCYTCLRIETIWAKLTDDLESVGFGIATGKFFSKVKFSLVIFSTFELSRQKLDPKLIEKTHFKVF